MAQQRPTPAPQRLQSLEAQLPNTGSAEAKLKHLTFSSLAENIDVCNQLRLLLDTEEGELNLSQEDIALKKNSVENILKPRLEELWRRVSEWMDAEIPENVLYPKTKNEARAYYAGISYIDEVLNLLCSPLEAGKPDESKLSKKIHSKTVEKKLALTANQKEVQKKKKTLKYMIAATLTFFTLMLAAVILTLTSPIDLGTTFTAASLLTTLVLFLISLTKTIHLAWKGLQTDLSFLNSVQHQAIFDQAIFPYFNPEFSFKNNYRLVAGHILSGTIAFSPVLGSKPIPLFNEITLWDEGRAAQEAKKGKNQPEQLATETVTLLASSTPRIETLPSALLQIEVGRQGGHPAIAAFPQGQASRTPDSKKDKYPPEKGDNTSTSTL